MDRVRTTTTLSWIVATLILVSGVFLFRHQAPSLIEAGGPQQESAELEDCFTGHDELVRADAVGYSTKLAAIAAHPYAQDEVGLVEEVEDATSSFFSNALSSYEVKRLPDGSWIVTGGSRRTPCSPSIDAFTGIRND